MILDSFMLGFILAISRASIVAVLSPDSVAPLSPFSMITSTSAMLLPNHSFTPKPSTSNLFTGRNISWIRIASLFCVLISISSSSKWSKLKLMIIIHKIRRVMINNKVPCPRSNCGRDSCVSIRLGCHLVDSFLIYVSCSSNFAEWMLVEWFRSARSPLHVAWWMMLSHSYYDDIHDEADSANRLSSLSSSWFPLSSYPTFGGYVYFSWFELIRVAQILPLMFNDSISVCIIIYA